MASDFYIKQNDTKEALSATLKDQNGAVDLQGATVRFHMRHADGENQGTVKVDEDASNDQVGDGSDGSKGQVSYDWSGEGDTDTAGKYAAEWEVTFSDGSIQTFPNDGNLVVTVVGEIA